MLPALVAGLVALTPAAGQVHPATAATTTPTVSSSTPPITCPPVVPSAMLVAASRTTLTFSFYAPCGEPVNLHLYRDAAGRQEVGNSWKPARSFTGTITFTGLSPDTYHWYRVGATPGQDDDPGSTPVWGPVRTTAVEPSPSPLPSATYVCPPVVPSATFGSASTTTLSFEIGFLCNTPATVHLYADPGGRQEMTSGTTRAVVQSSSTLAITGLTPDTDYYYTLTVPNSSWIPPIAGPVHTLPRPTPIPTGPTPTTTGPAPTTTGPGPTTTGPTIAPATAAPGPTSAPPVPPACSASIHVLSRWNDGFVADLTVTNTGTSAITWRAAWTWTDGQTLVSAYDSANTGTSSSPVLTGVGWNTTLRPTVSISIVLLGRGRGGVPAVTCRPA